MRKMRTLRRLAALAAGFATLPAFAATPAAAGEYTVVQCGAQNRAYDDARFERTHGGDYAFGKHCGEAAAGDSLQVRSISNAPNGHRGTIGWSAPAGTKLTEAAFEARLRRDGGHRARVSFVGAAGSEAGAIATGEDLAGGFESYRERTDGRSGLMVSLACEQGSGCARSEQARSWIREVRLTIDDRTAPALEGTGSLLRSGWIRGAASLELGATDRGSGIAAVGAEVNGIGIGPERSSGCATIGRSQLARRLQPCPADRRSSLTLDTTRKPFVDGVNRVELCATDFGARANRTCEPHSVSVDNSAPQLAFRGNPDPERPERIVALAEDRHSGVASGTIAYRPLQGGSWRELDTEHRAGELQAAVDSLAEPKGRYLFAVSATDRAGNSARSERRRDGTRMILEFPLKTATRISGQVRDGSKVGYGERPWFEGRLAAAEGPVPAGERVLVVERFGDGAEPERTVHSTRTDARGRYEVRLDAGPSRRVIARYEGSPRWIGSESDPVRISVGGRARLKVAQQRVRAGQKARFRASVGRRGVRIARGKLVELQVRAAGEGRYRTVRQALRTTPRGRLRTAYSFDRFYTRPARFQFRLKVTPENGWPYRAPTHSRARRITVLPR